MSTMQAEQQRRRQRWLTVRIFVRDLVRVPSVVLAYLALCWWLAGYDFLRKVFSVHDKASRFSATVVIALCGGVLLVCVGLGVASFVFCIEEVYKNAKAEAQKRLGPKE